MRPTYAGLGLLTATVAALSTSPTFAQNGTVLIDTFGPGDSYELNTGNGVTGPGNSPFSSVTANKFTITGPSVDLGTVTIAMELDNSFGGYGLNLFDLDVETSVPFSPGSNVLVPSGVSLESFQLSNQMAHFGQSGSAITVTSVAHPLLQSGVTYWVVASVPDTTTSAAWMGATITDTTPFGIAQRDPAGGVWGFGDGHDAFRVTALAAPESPSIASFAIGTLALYGLGLRARRRGTRVA